MRKYRILALLIILFSSLLGLLIYRNEYNKLRSTFEVLNYFSSSENLNNCLVLNESIVQSYKYKNLFSNSPPQWVSLGDFYIYSAFWHHVDSSDYARAIGVGPKSIMPNFECHVWFDHQDTLISLNGRLTFTTSHYNNTVWAVYDFLCMVDLTGVKGIPYVFVFIKKNEQGSKKIFVPIFSKTTGNFTSKKNELGVCVKPDKIGYTKSDLIEFMAFHQIVGMSDIIIYDNGIHHGILNKLKYIESLKSFIRSITVLPWYFPFEDPFIEIQALELDCLSRMSGVLPLVSVLDWNQYLVPKKKRLMSEIRQNFNGKGPKQILLKSQVCCTNIKNDKRSDMSWPVVLRKTHCTKISKENILFLNPTQNGAPTEESLQASGTVNTYQSCDISKSSLEYDSSSHRFSFDLLENKLLHLWKSGTLFTH